MARHVLLVAGGAWIVAGVAACVAAVVGVDRITGMLPPLEIDRDAVARTIVALGSALGVAGIAHVIVAIGLGRGRAWAVSAGILLSAAAAMLGVALAAAALTSAAAGTMQPLVALGAAVASLLAALAYGAAAAALVHRLRLGGRR